MFTPDFFIDTVQSYKKTFTNQVIKDETLNQAAHAYIDAQTAFAKMLTQNTVTLTKYAVDRVAKSQRTK